MFSAVIGKLGHIFGKLDLERYNRWCIITISMYRQTKLSFKRGSKPAKRAAKAKFEIIKISYRYVHSNICIFFFFFEGGGDV